MQDLAQYVKPAVGLKYAQLTATTTGEIIDTMGYESITIVTYVDTIATADSSNYFTINPYLSSSSTFVGSGTVVASADMIGTQTVLNATVASGSDTVHWFGIKPAATLRTRYLRVSATETGTSDATIAVVVLLGHGAVVPETPA